ncbi:MAG: SDR family oxidoreductase [Bacteroidota bacterium]
MGLEKRVAIVTGASRGIGKMIAAELARKGMRVVLAARNETMLRSVQVEIERSGGTAMAVTTDVTSEESVRRLVETTISTFGAVDVLVNNAGVGYFSHVMEMPLPQFDAMMDVNLKGMFLCCKAVLPHMSEQRRGEIINIASLAGKNSFAGGSVYSATKWGVIGFSRSLMLEVREQMIRVITICPGSVNTQFGNSDRNNPAIIQPEDVAATVVFALTMPDRVNVSEIDIRPTIKPE